MNTHVPLRSILLATNLTDIEWLFPFTCSLAEESGAHITVLHVISAINSFSIDLAGYPYYDPRDAMAAVKQQLEGFCTKTCAARIKAEVVALDGTPARQILAMANDVHADLVVMGTRAHRGIDKWVFGSVAESVLRSSSIPVITVGPNARRAAASGRPIKSILFATSLMSHATDTANADLMLKCPIKAAFSAADRIRKTVCRRSAAVHTLPPALDTSLRSAAWSYRIRRSAQRVHFPGLVLRAQFHKPPRWKDR